MNSADVRKNAVTVVKAVGDERVKECFSVSDRRIDGQLSQVVEISSRQSPDVLGKIQISLSVTTPRHMTSVEGWKSTPYKLMDSQLTFASCCLVPSQVNCITCNNIAYLKIKR